MKSEGIDFKGNTPSNREFFFYYSHDAPMIVGVSDYYALKIRMEVASSRPDHLPTLSVAKTSKLSRQNSSNTTSWRLMRQANNNNHALKGFCIFTNMDQHYCHLNRCVAEFMYISDKPK